jgi:hypothetical protein
MRIAKDVALNRRTYRKIAFVPNSHLWPWIFRAIGVIAAAGTVWFASTLSGWMIGGGFAVAFFTAPTVTVARGWRRVRAAGITSYRYEIDDDGIHTRQTNTNTVIRWEGISRARAVRDAWIFQFSGKIVGIAIPRFVFSPAEQAEIDAYVAARYPRKTPNALLDGPAANG